MRRWFPTLMILAGAAVTGAAIGVGPDFTRGGSARSTGEPVANCRAVDGDTLRCDGERIRLLGIDAPELPGHCRPGRACAPGDPVASNDSLAGALTPPLTIERVGTDRYGRTLALVTSRHGDLSCWQLGQNQAIYMPRWDNGGRLAATCPAAR